MSRLKIYIFLFACHLAVNGGKGGVKNKMLKNNQILTGKMYIVQIYKRKQHTKNLIDWIKNEVTGEIPGLLYNLIPGSCLTFC